MPLNAGELTARIKLERDQVIQESGAEKRTPTVYATIWAKAEALSGREAWRAQQVNSSVNWRFTTYYRTDVRPNDRIIYRGRRMEIRAVLPDEQCRDSVALLCEAKN